MTQQYHDIQCTVAGVVQSTSTLREEASSLSAVQRGLLSQVDDNESQARMSAEEITSLKKRHIEELNALKQECSRLSSIISSSVSFTEPSAVPSPSTSAEIVIRGLPADLSLSDSKIVCAVFSFLGVPLLSNVVLDSRVTRPKSSQPSDSSASSSTANAATKKSLVIRMKSPTTRDFILEKASAKRVLSVRDIGKYSVSRHQP